MEFGNFDGQIAHGWHDPQATWPPSESAQTTGGATNHRYAFPEGPGAFSSVSKKRLRTNPATSAEGPYGLLGLGHSVPNSSQGLLPTEANTYGDWPVFDDHLIDPSVGNGFYLQMLPQLDPFEFLTQPSYPTAGLGQAFQPIAPAPATAVQPNIIAAPSRAPPVARRRTIEPRFQCNIDGCTKAYRRVGDCRRHMRKHQAPNLRCVVEGCHMKFDRMDKLREHVRQGHKLNL